MVWTLEDNPLDTNKIFRYIFKQSGSKDLANTITRFIDLRKYLEKNKFQNASELRQNILSKGTPVFSKDESEIIFNLTLKTGGGEILDGAVQDFVTFVYDLQPAIAKDLIDYASPLVFILKTLESSPEFGPLLGVSLDTITAALPTIASSIENLAPELAGPPGALIGWMIASIFVSLSMMLHVSRAQFGQAFTNSFLLIPFLGTSLYNAAMSGERLVETISKKRDRLIKVVKKLFGDDIGYTIDGLTPEIPHSAKGGKRLSSRLHRKGKWRTQKKLR